MSRKKTLIILTPGFPKSESDSTCLPMQQALVRTLCDLYPSLKIIVLTFQYPYHSKHYEWFDIPVLPFNGRNKGDFTKIFLRSKIQSTLIRFNKTENIVGILSFWSNECAWVGKKFADQFKIQHYCWILGQDAGKANHYPAKISFRANELVAVSDFIQAEYEKNHGVRPQFVIPPGVEKKQLQVSGTTKDVDIAGIGSLIPLKQYDIFLKVVVAIKKTVPGVRAVIAGKGTEETLLKNMITDLGLEDNVQLTGELSYPEVITLLGRSKILLHPSSYEGFSGVCLEALSQAAQVISFRKPMTDDIPQWQIARDEEDMINQALEMLKQYFHPVTEELIPFPIEQTARSFAKLFGI